MKLYKREHFGIDIYSKFSGYYFDEQKKIQTTISKKESDLERLKDSVSNVSAFIDKAGQYTPFY